MLVPVFEDCGCMHYARARGLAREIRYLLCFYGKYTKLCVARIVKTLGCEHCLILLMVRINDPHIVIQSSLLIRSPEKIKALLECLALRLFFISEYSLLDPHGPLLPQPLSCVSVHIILFIHNGSQRMHLSESDYVRIHMVIVEMLIVDPLNDRGPSVL